MNPDTCGRGDSIPRIRICVDSETFKSGKKSLRIQKCLVTCGRDLNGLFLLRALGGPKLVFFIARRPDPVDSRFDEV